MRLLTTWYLCFLAFTSSALATDWDQILKEGDLIFQRSRSAQAGALEEATESIWTHVGTVFKNDSGWSVAEASRTVTWTPIENFARNGKNGAFVVKRLRGGAPNDAKIKKLRSAFQSYVGKPYDIYFEWSADRIYCSELVWKAFDSAANLKIGRVQKFKDLKLDGPEVQKLIDQRLTSIGRTLDKNEKIITPIAMFDAPTLEQVYSHGSPN